MGETIRLDAETPAHIERKHGATMRKWLLLGVALCAAVLLASALLGHGSPTRRVTPPDRDTLPPYVEDLPQARELAGQACDILDTFLSQVRRDRPAPEVQRSLRRLEATALQAYSHDVRWIQLLTAAKSLQESLRADDPQAAELALRTAGEQCTLARVQ